MPPRFPAKNRATAEPTPQEKESAVTTLAQRSAESWTPCTFQGHLDDLQRRHEDVGEPILDHPLTAALTSRQELVGSIVAVAALMDHLAGKHADGCLVVE